jgi:hypothetical protein
LDRLTAVQAWEQERDFIDTRVCRRFGFKPGWSHPVGQPKPGRERESLMATCLAAGLSSKPGLSYPEVTQAWEGERELCDE